MIHVVIEVLKVEGNEGTWYVQYLTFLSKRKARKKLREMEDLFSLKYMGSKKGIALRHYAELTGKGRSILPKIKTYK